MDDIKVGKFPSPNGEARFNPYAPQPLYDADSGAFCGADGEKIDFSSAMTAK